MTYIAYCRGKTHGLRFKYIGEADSFKTFLERSENHFELYPNFDVLGIAKEDIE